MIYYTLILNHSRNLAYLYNLIKLLSFSIDILLLWRAGVSVTFLCYLSNFQKQISCKVQFSRTKIHQQFNFFCFKCLLRNLSYSANYDLHENIVLVTIISYFFHSTFHPIKDKVYYLSPLSFVTGLPMLSIWTILTFCYVIKSTFHSIFLRDHITRTVIKITCCSGFMKKAYI